MFIFYLDICTSTHFYTLYHFFIHACIQAEGHMYMYIYICIYYRRAADCKHTYTLAPDSEAVPKLLACFVCSLAKTATWRNTTVARSEMRARKCDGSWFGIRDKPDIPEKVL